MNYRRPSFFFVSVGHVLTILTSRLEWGCIDVYRVVGFLGRVAFTYTFKCTIFYIVNSTRSENAVLGSGKRSQEVLHNTRQDLVKVCICLFINNS